MANLSGFEDLTCNFPLSIDPNRVFYDVNASNKEYVDAYMRAVSNGDFDTAASLMKEHSDLKNIIINASVIQLLYDMNIAVQRVYKSDIQTLIGQVVKYRGTYDNTQTYSMFNIVTYNYKAYMNISNSTPAGTLPTDTAYWIQMTIQGESGTGMTFYTTYDSTFSYSIQDCVPYGNKLYVSITDNNLGHIPSDASSADYWKPVVTVPSQTIWSKTQPTNQDENGVWNKINDDDSSYETYECLGNNIYVQKFPVSKAEYVKTDDGSTVQDFIDNLDAEQVGAIPSSEKGVANGVATLNKDGTLKQDANTLGGKTSNEYVQSFGIGAGSPTVRYIKIAEMTTDVGSGENGLILYIHGISDFGKNTPGLDILQASTRDDINVEVKSILETSNRSVYYGYVENKETGKTEIWLKLESYNYHLKIFIGLKSAATIFTDTTITTTEPSGIIYVNVDYLKASDTTSIASALTLVGGGTTPPSTLGNGKLWGGY